MTYLSPRLATVTHIADLTESVLRYSNKSDFNAAHIDSLESGPASRTSKSAITTTHIAGTRWDVSQFRVTGLAIEFGDGPTISEAAIVV